jgi:DNA-directed RNA polymerase specialized sigma24 family protein
MYMDEPAMVNSLRRLVTRLTWNRSLQQDLLQEALIHLWLIETRRPGQTISWYLQSCRFHLQHYLSSGRSVDSAKRRAGQVDPQDPLDTEETETSEDLLFSEVSTRDLIELLSHHLSPPEKAVLDCLAEGLGPREIGRRLQISHTMARKHRFRIAELLTRLDSHRADQGQSTPLLAVEPARDKASSGFLPPANHPNAFANANALAKALSGQLIPENPVPVLRAA